MIRVCLALVLAASLGGCITFISATQGPKIDPDKLAQVERGKTKLPELLALLGAPQEVHNHADGRLLVYRHRLRHTFRLGLSISQALRAIDLSQVVSEALSNVSLTVERINAGEDRLMVLIDESR